MYAYRKSHNQIIDFLLCFSPKNNYIYINIDDFKYKHHS